MSDLPYTKKSLGQHWLTDEATLDAMCHAAEIGDDDVVLEVGPGAGTLTKKLVERADSVVAIEFDEKLARTLPQRIKANNLEVKNQDILKFDLTKMPPDYKVAANIPYYLTSKLIRVLMESSNAPLITALLVQKEVAQRVAASPGEMSLLSVSAQFYAEVSLGEIVPAYLFTPPPKVDSQILILKRRDKLPFEINDTKTFFKIVKAGFSARRKTLLNSLSGGLRLGKTEVESWLEKAGIDPKRRPQELSLEEWHKLYTHSLV